MPIKKDETLLALTEDERTDIAVEIVKHIIIDINKRAGFGASYRMIDNLTKKEMISRWHFLVTEVLESFK